MALRLDEVEQRLGAECSGRSDLELRRLAPLHTAEPGELSFIPHKNLRKQLLSSAASAVIVDRESASLCRRSLPIIVDDVLVACARAARWLPLQSRLERARNRALCAYETIAPDAVVCAGAVVGRAVTIGAHTRIGPGSVIGDGARIGNYCQVDANVIVGAAATLGNRTRIGANSTIGGDAFTYVRDGRRWLKLPDFGSVEIGDDVDIGSNTTIDRGAIGHTTVRNGTKIDNHVHIGHGSVIGCNVAIAAHAAIAGEVTVGDGSVIGGAVGIGEGVVIARDCRVTGMSMVTKSLAEPGRSYSSGWPAERSSTWWRRVAQLTGRRRRNV